MISIFLIIDKDYPVIKEPENCVFACLCTHLCVTLQNDQIIHFHEKTTHYRC